MARSYRHQFEASLNLFIERYSGETHWRDMIESWQEASKNLAFRPGMDNMVDLTEAEFDLGYEDVEEFVPASAAAPKEGISRIAVIAPSSLQFGLVRMYQILSEGSGAYNEMRVFSTLADAREWLRLPDDFEISD